MQNTASPKKKKKRIKKLAKSAFRLVLMLLILVFTAENYLQITGYQRSQYSIDLHSRMRWFNAHGIHYSSENPASIEIIWPNDQRRSRQRMEKNAPYRAAFFGDSYTYGAAINDWETYCWRLNEKFPDVCFDNYAVGGYGPYQCYLAFIEELSKRKYDMAIYSLWHGQLRRECWEHQRSDGSLEPWVEYNNGEFIEHPTPTSSYLFMTDSYLLSFLRRVSVGMSAKKAVQTSAEHKKEALTALVLKMQSFAKKNNIDFIICLLDETKSFYFNTEDIDTAGIDVVEVAIQYNDYNKFVKEYK
ncbi:SGNH/GDSL hydrolase family protein, partial [bacterium]|nr:SGNH/GDSL hydrolase family protein [bacterium]